MLPERANTKLITPSPTTYEAKEKIIGGKGQILPPEVTDILRKSKGLSASDIIKQNPDINLKRDVSITDIHGVKKVIPEGEALTPYELKGNKVLLQDGETYIVSKNQYQNIKGNTVSGEAKDFAPELKGTKETIKGASKWQGDELIVGGGTVANVVKNEDGTWSYQSDFSEGSETFSTRAKAMKEAEMSTKSKNKTKYSQYQLPDGKNYKEILIKAPREAPTYAGGEKVYHDKEFVSSHWDEPNVIAHIRMNERTYKGKKVAFMEELQSDWAREVRSKNPKYINVIPDNPLLKNWQELSIKRALKDAVDSEAEYFSWINGEQTSARYNLATYVDDVNWKSAYGEGAGQGSKRINIITKDGNNSQTVVINKAGLIKEGKTDWKDKKLDEVLGKGLADKIMEKETGTLSGEGLKFGGEWANNLYDKQVGNIVSDLTGAKVEKLDMGLPIEKGQTDLFIQKPGGKVRLEVNDLKVGKTITKSTDDYIITDILGDGKFKAMPKGMKSAEVRMAEFKAEPQRFQNLIETFDISTKKTTQQGIRITPEIKAKIQGKAIKLKKPSGISPLPRRTLDGIK